MSAQIPDSMLLSDLLKSTGYDCPEEAVGKTMAEVISGGDTKISTNTDAEIDVSVSVPNGPVQEQKVMFKIDTVTGDVWVLQLTVNGQNDPTFAAANWVKVQHGSIKQPSNGNNNNPQGF